MPLSPNKHSVKLIIALGSSQILLSAYLTRVGQSHANEIIIRVKKSKLAMCVKRFKAESHVLYLTLQLWLSSCPERLYILRQQIP